MLYSDFSFSDYVGVSILCARCHEHSPEVTNAANMIAWIETHMVECNADLRI